MRRPLIYYDAKSGNLKKGLIWQPTCDMELILGGGGWLYGETSWVDEDARPRDLKGRRVCPLVPTHVYYSTETRLHADLFGVKKLGDFVPIDGVGWYVSRSFANRLKKSALTGYDVENRVAINCNQSGVLVPQIFALQFLGIAGYDLRWKVRHGENQCPHCGKGPVICPSCGATNRECLVCATPTLYLPQAPNVSSDKGFAIEDYPEWIPKAYVVEGATWDGSDFFNTGHGCFVSNRAKRWMERTRAFPIAFQPALLNVDGMDPALLKKLKEDA